MKPQVYVVDDDANVRRSICFLLRSYDYDCRPFADGVAFLDELEALGPGCVLLDMSMPRRNGLEVQAELTRRGSRLAVIAMSGEAGMDDAPEARDLGAIDMLEKPFAEEALLAALRAGFARLASAKGKSPGKSNPASPE